MEFDPSALISNASSSRVKSKKIHPKHTKVFNFEVENFHSYFVGEGALWVHNESGILNAQDIDGKALSRKEKDWVKNKVKNINPSCGTSNCTLTTTAISINERPQDVVKAITSSVNKKGNRIIFSDQANAKSTLRAIVQDDMPKIKKKIEFTGTNKFLYKYTPDEWNRNIRSTGVNRTGFVGGYFS